MYDLWTSSCVARQHHHRHHDATALTGADDVGRWTTTRTAVDDDDGEGFHDARATVRSLFVDSFSHVSCLATPKPRTRNVAHGRERMND